VIDLNRVPTALYSGLCMLTGHYQTFPALNNMAGRPTGLCLSVQALI